MNAIHVDNLPPKEINTFLERMQSEDPEFFYYSVTTPRGYDAEADRVRKLGQVQVFKQQRPVRVRDVDKVAHRLVRKG